MGARGAGAAPFPPKGVAPPVSAAAQAPVAVRQRSQPSAIAAALTVFEGQAVFRTIVCDASDHIVLLRFRRGSRTLFAERFVP
jgi:hypothetical protein